MNNKEFLKSGYTPKNLTDILYERGLKREDVADFFGLNVRQIHRWAVDLDNDNHSDMPLDKWRKFLVWAATKPIVRPAITVDGTNKLAAYFNADLQSTNLKAIIAEIPLQFKSDLSEYLEQGIEQAAHISERKWDEILVTKEILRFRSCVVALSFKAKKESHLCALYDTDPDSYLVAKTIARNPNADDDLRAKCIAVLRDCKTTGWAGSNYELIWEGTGYKEEI